MPRGDGTSPVGYGPITGRRTGFCAGFSVQRHPKSGYGYRRGFRNRFCARNMPFSKMPLGPFSLEKEANFLSQRAEYLKQELKTIENRLNQLKSPKKEK